MKNKVNIDISNGILIIGNSFLLVNLSTKKPASTNEKIEVSEYTINAFGIAYTLQNFVSVIND